MDFMEKMDSLLKECCTHWATSNEILYPLRKLYPKKYNFSRFTIKKPNRTEATDEDIGKLIRICKKIEDTLDIDDYNSHYYLQLQAERFHKLYQ